MKGGIKGVNGWVQGASGGTRGCLVNGIMRESLNTRIMATTQESRSKP